MDAVLNNLLLGNVQSQRLWNKCVMSVWAHALQEYFMKLVDDTVEVSVKHVRAFVHQYLSARLNEARSQIEQYGSRYTEAMLHALETSKQGTAPAMSISVL